MIFILLIEIILVFDFASNVHSKTVVNNFTVSSDFFQDLFFDEIKSNINLDDLINSEVLDAQKCIVQLQEIVSQFPSLKVARFTICLCPREYSRLAIKEDLEINQSIDDSFNLGVFVKLTPHALSIEIKIVDSWGKLPSGILYGNFKDLGNYDQCVRTAVVLKEGSEATHGQYCTASFPILPLIPFPKRDLSLVQDNFLDPRLNLDISKIFSIKLGVCIPDACNANLITTIFQKAAANVLNGIFEGATVSQCSLAKKPDFEAFDIFAIVLFSAVGALMIFSTAYDWFTEYFEKKPKDLLLAFSIITNGRKLFMIKTTKSPNSIQCLTGIRVLSMIWVLHCHNYMFYTSMNIINIIDGLSWIKMFWSMTVAMGTLAVDSFFFLSGLLIAWLCFKELDKTKGKLNVFLMWVHRYIRLTPPLAAVILFYLTLNKYIGSGPLREDSINMHSQCKETWWSTLLYVQNYVSSKNMCVLQSWYLAIDTQLYVLSPLVLIPLWKWGKKCIPVLVVLVFLAIGCVFTIFYNEGYKTLLGFGEPGRTAKIYFPTHIRFPPWLVGVGLGYIMHVNRQKCIRPHVGLRILGWLLSFGTLLAIIFGPHSSMKSSLTVTVGHAAAYEAFKRVSWSIALAWIVFACHFGFGGKVNSILSHPCWQPLGNLTYCMYLVHVGVLSFNFGISRTSVFFSDYTLMLVFWSNFGITFLVAIVLSLSFEAPVLVIEKAIFGRKNQREPLNQTSLPIASATKGV